MAPVRLATFSIDGSQRYGLVTADGIVDLSARFGKEYPTLREAVAAGALMKLAEAAERQSADYALETITWQPPIPAPEKIICIGVNYPDRNAEYKDGQDAPKYPSMFLRTPRSFVGHLTPLVRPRASAQLDYEGELVLVIGKAGRHISKARRSTTSPRLRCATKAPSATGSGTPSSMSRKVRISIPQAAWARGSFLIATKHSLPTSG